MPAIQIDPRKFVERCVADAQRRPTLRMGSSGPDVHTWKVLMGKELGSPMTSTDVFDGRTQLATQALQRKVGIPADGVVGPKTWAAGLVAPCYAAALHQQQMATHGVGAFDLSFSVLDTKSMVLGVVIGVAAGAVLFRKK